VAGPERNTVNYRRNADWKESDMVTCFLMALTAVNLRGKNR
jgi:hypothetical protein